ncbi:MAG: hypothetical protein U0736_25550 [Gemmataceae bacterium]
MSHFKAFIGAADVAAIDEDTWHRWYLHIKKQLFARQQDKKHKKAGWSADYCKKVFGLSRSFVRWLWVRRTLPELPRNLFEKANKFTSPKKTIQTFTNEEIHDLLGRAKGKHRLLFLLLLNLGGTQKDIADLRIDEVDLKEKTITRFRSKTEDLDIAYQVTYKLWSTTAQLLEKYMNTSGELALTTRLGQPWVHKRLVNGRLKKADNLATVFQKYNTTDKSLKHFRKTASTRLAANPKFASIVGYFLQHDPDTVAKKHYIDPPAELIKEACVWLGQEYGID